MKQDDSLLQLRNCPLRYAALLSTHRRFVRTVMLMPHISSKKLSQQSTLTTLQVTCGWNPVAGIWLESGWIWLDLAPSGSIWLDLAGSGWIWLDLAPSGWIWLHLAGSGSIWLDLAGCSTLAPNARKVDRNICFRGGCRGDTTMRMMMMMICFLYNIDRIASQG